MVLSEERGVAGLRADAWDFRAVGFAIRTRGTSLGVRAAPEYRSKRF